MTVSEWLASAESRLILAGVENPRMEAQVLLAHSMFVDRSYLFAHPEAEINDLAAEQLLEKREEGLPLAYVTGWREFYGRQFGVDPAVLVPRHETECLVEAVLKVAKPDSKVLDLGTGSGIIAITLKLERPDLEVTAVDISASALTTASANANILNAKVRFILSDRFESLLGEGFDLIVTNPPYIGRGELLPREVAEHEPGLALFAEEGGLSFYRMLSEEAQHYLNDQGRILMEVGYRQSQEVQGLFTGAGWKIGNVHQDLAGVERVVEATYDYV